MRRFFGHGMRKLLCSASLCCVVLAIFLVLLYLDRQVNHCLINGALSSWTHRRSTEARTSNVALLIGLTVTTGALQRRFSESQAVLILKMYGYMFQVLLGNLAKTLD